MTAPGLFPEPARVPVPDELAGWSVEQLVAGTASSVRVGDWEAAHRVVRALIDRRALGGGLDGGTLWEMVAVVLDLHQPQRMYRDCRHHHEEDDDGQVPDGVFWLGGLDEYVCELGYAGTVCQTCDIGEDGDGPPEGTWPCPTFRSVADKLVEALGVRL